MRKLRSGRSVGARRRSDVEELRSPYSGNKTFDSRYPGVDHQWISELWSMNRGCHSLMRCLEDRLQIHMVSYCKCSPRALSSLTVIITLIKLLVLCGVWRR